METIYDYYRKYKDVCKQKADKMKEFFDILIEIKLKSYEERADIVEKIWGKPEISPKTYKYGDSSYIEISQNGDSYNFNFTYDNKDFLNLRSIYPKYAEKLKKQGYIC